MDFVNDVCSKVVSAVADGQSAAQKCLKFLATGRMRGILWCGRDRAHAMRTSTPDTSDLTATISAFYFDIF